MFKAVVATPVRSNHNAEDILGREKHADTSVDDPPEGPIVHRWKGLKHEAKGGDDNDGTCTEVQKACQRRRGWSVEQVVQRRFPAGLADERRRVGRERLDEAGLHMWAARRFSDVSHVSSSVQGPCRKSPEPKNSVIVET